MKRNVLIFGLILGAILAGNMVIMVKQMYGNPNMEPNAVIGYAAQIVIFSLIFFGVRNYRNKELNGTISLGHAFKVGAFVALVGSTIYVVTWLFYYYLAVPDFIDQYTVCVLNQTTREGATAAELSAKKAEMAEFGEMYKNPFFVVVTTYIEVLPVGLAVAFVSALILKKKTVVVS